LISEYEACVLAGLKEERYELWEKIVASNPERFKEYPHTLAVAEDLHLHRRIVRNLKCILDVQVGNEWYYIIEQRMIDWMDENLSSSWSLPKDSEAEWPTCLVRWTFADEEDMLLFKMKWL
jgi:hypothetical protein